MDMNHHEPIPRPGNFPEIEMILWSSTFSATIFWFPALYIGPWSTAEAMAATTRSGASLGLGVRSTGYKHDGNPLFHDISCYFDTTTTTTTTILGQDLGNFMNFLHQTTRDWNKISTAKGRGPSRCRIHRWPENMVAIHDMHLSIVPNNGLLIYIHSQMHT